MKRQRTMRPLAALAAVAGAVGLAAAGPLAGTAAAQGNEDGNHHKRQIGYICDFTTENYLDTIGAVRGDYDCEPVNGAPFFGDIDRPFYIATDDEGNLYRCEYGAVEVTNEVVGYECEELDEVI